MTVFLWHHHQVGDGGGPEEVRKERRRCTSAKKEQRLRQEEDSGGNEAACRPEHLVPHADLNNFNGIQQQYVYSGAAQRVGQRWAAIQLTMILHLHSFNTPVFTRQEQSSETLRPSTGVSPSSTVRAAKWRMVRWGHVGSLQGLHSENKDAHRHSSAPDVYKPLSAKNFEQKYQWKNKVRSKTVKIIFDC